MSIKYFNLEKLARARVGAADEAQVLENYKRFGGAFEEILEEAPQEEVPAPKPRKLKGRSKKK